jgi:CIC family chloride channel protein
MENGSDGVSKSATASAQAKSEIQEYLEVSEQRHKLFPRAVAVGLVAGTVAVLFRALLAGGDVLRNGLVNWSHSMPALGWIFPLLFGAVGAVVAVWLVLRYAPETGGSGIPHLKAVLDRLRDLSWTRVLVVKMISGVLALSSGLALGREGPTVQMGGAVADGLARGMNLSSGDRLTLITAGAGAGLAAADPPPREWS